ncbi:MAG: ferredoxin [Acidobacteria bacterium]|nr:ferredoxin [Acidobacteriota bacterium]
MDDSCIDCDACRQIAPGTFHDHGDASSVYRQPEMEADIKRAIMALVTCPTGSIGTTEKHDARIGIDSFPELIDGNIYFCGFTAESSFGAWSYLIVRPDDEGGNVLVDSPRFAGQLVKKIDALSGVRAIFLTHRDDVADQSIFARKFGARRVMHADDNAARFRP